MDRGLGSFSVGVTISHKVESNRVVDSHLAEIYVLVVKT